jgi:hypothetical protein
MTEIRTLTENRIQLLIFHIAVKKLDDKLAEIIKEEIIEQVGLSARGLTYILENRSQPTKAESLAIASILKKYLPEITIKDLTDFGNDNSPTEAGDHQQG